MAAEMRQGPIWRPYLVPNLAAGRVTIEFVMANRTPTPKMIDPMTFTCGGRPCRLAFQVHRHGCRTAD